MRRLSGGMTGTEHSSCLIVLSADLAAKPEFFRRVIGRVISGSNSAVKVAIKIG